MNRRTAGGRISVAPRLILPVDEAVVLLHHPVDALEAVPVASPLGGDAGGVNFSHRLAGGVGEGEIELTLEYAEAPAARYRLIQVCMVEWPAPARRAASRIRPARHS